MEFRGKNSFDNIELAIDIILCDSSVENQRCAHSSEQDVKDYLGNPEMVLLYNEVSFDNRFY